MVTLQKTISVKGLWEIWVREEKNGTLVCFKFLFAIRADESKSESEVTQILCDPKDCSLTGSSVHGIFQAKILEWVAISFSRRSSRPRNWTRVSLIVGRCFTIWATREAQAKADEVSENIYVSQGILYIASSPYYQW